MSVIYTNENNPAGLKLIIAKSQSKKEVAVKIVNVHERSLEQPRHLPYLEIDNSLVLFSSNAALFYLCPLPSKVDAQAANEWLEWESTVLAPSLALLIGSNLKSDYLKSTLNTALKKLNTFLKNKKFILSDQLTIVDISIWCTLYPLYVFGKTEEHFKEYHANLTDIDAWFKNLENDATFQESLQSFTLKGCHPSYNSLLNGGKYLVSASQDASTPKTEQTPEVTVTEEELEAAKNAFLGSETFPPLKPIEKTVLPVSGEKNVFITSALPYVNNVPHLGNIIGCVLSSDVFARFSRLCNQNTLFISGTDEYGTATETKALEEGLSCQAICDKYHKIHRETYEWFNISFNYFGRTSTPHQTEICQDMFLKLNDNGFMFTQSVEQLHCDNCKKFLADRFVEGGCPNAGCTYEDARGDQCDACGKLVNAIELKNPRCKICSQSPKIKTSNQFFIDLPKLEPLLHHWMKKSSSNWSNNAQVIARTWLREGLKPRCITRDLKWGVPVPLEGFRDKVFYVWFDAPIGYMSILKAYTDKFEKWWIPEKDADIDLYQFMAKDNVPFHSVLFPACLLGANRGYLTVSHIMATEYLNYEDGKFSKSRGVGVFGTDVQKTGIPSDVWRFYLLYVRPESQDSSFSWVDLATKNNSELLNNLGNFINRSLMFAKNCFDSVVPAINQLSNEDLTLLALCTKEFKQYVNALEKCKLRDGIRHILAISKLGNQFMQSNQPWVLVKGTDEQKLRAGTVIGLCCNIVALLELLLRPYMPITSDTIKKQINGKDLAINLANVCIVQLLPSGHKLGEPSPLFAKIEPARVDELKKMFAGKQGDRVPVEVQQLELEVQKQADKVRALKSSKADKKIWQPEVAILLDLKKKLEECQKNKAKATAGGDAPVQGTPEEVKALESEIAKQGDKVRSLKASGVEKAVWQPEVNILLSLKKKLEELQKFISSKSSAPQNGVNPDEIKRLEEEVNKQALKVRKLKEGKAEKSVWQPEVDILLKLKAELVAAGGAPAAAPQKGKKGK